MKTSVVRTKHGADFATVLRARGVGWLASGQSEALVADGNTGAPQ